MLPPILPRPDLLDTEHIQGHRTAFTLIELLTVIAIIGILAAILIPTVGKVRETARMASSISRLRECGTALQLFAGDNRQRLPDAQSVSQGARWPKFIAGYIGTYEVSVFPGGAAQGRRAKLEIDDAIFYTNEKVLRDTTQEGQPGAQGIFGYNINLCDQPVGAGVLISQITTPSTFPVLATTQGDVGGGLTLRISGPSPLAKERGYAGDTTHVSGPSPNFGNKALFLFGDWHVKAHDICNKDKWPWNDPEAFSL